MNKQYKEFLDDTEGSDPDFPGMDFGGEGKKINGQNIATLGDGMTDNNTDDYGI